jgi:hypothetical protein
VIELPEGAPDDSIDAAPDATTSSDAEVRES